MHHNDEATELLANPNHQPVKFTAQHIIDHIVNHCTCANDRAVQTIQMSIDKKDTLQGTIPFRLVPNIYTYSKQVPKGRRQAKLECRRTKDIMERSFCQASESCRISFNN